MAEVRTIGEAYGVPVDLTADDTEPELHRSARRSGSAD